jgi:co-chaperonin GroES (HSP10)
MTLKPIGSRFIVQYKKAEEKKGTLILPNEPAPQFATVLEIGTDNEIGLDIGDLVAISRYGGHEFIINGEKVLVVEMKDIIATLEKENET